MTITERLEAAQRVIAPAATILGALTSIACVFGGDLTAGGIWMLVAVMASK